MDSPDPGATPIGWTELIAGTVAVLVAVAAVGSMLVALANAPRFAQAASQAVSQGGADAPGNSSCAAPPLGGIRLGTPRSYGDSGGVRLDPVPTAVTPPVSAQQAYAVVAHQRSVCETELLLAYYSAGAPSADHLLAWVVVTTSSCSPDRCVVVAPVDATSGRVLSPSSFRVPAG